MCAALLRNQLFKPAPGCSHPDGMVPRSITRLPALVLAFGFCAPCFVRRLNAPMPLAPHALNTFHGQGRKARLEAARLRLLPGGRARSTGDASGAFSVITRATVSPTADAAAGVRPSSASTTSGLCFDSGDTVAAAAAVTATAAAAAGDGGSSGYTINWPGTSPLPRANASAVAAAAAAEGRLTRPRLEGRYQSLRTETTPRPSAELPSRGAFRCCTEDGCGGGGVDAMVHASTACLTPEMSAAAAAGAASSGAATFVTASSSHLNGNGQQCSQIEVLSGSHTTLATAVSASSAGTVAATAAAAASLPPPTPAGPATPSTSTPTPTTPARCTYPGTLATGLPPAHAAAFSVSLPPAVLAVETPGTVSPQATSSGAAPTNSVATPPRSSAGSKFLNNHSRSGRRIFPDPRVTSPGPDGASDGTHYHITAFSGDGGLPHVQIPDARSSLDPFSVAAGSSRDGDAGHVVQRSHTPGSAGAAAQSVSPRHPPSSSQPASSRSQQQLHTPRSSNNGLPQLQPRLEGSPSKLATAAAPLPPPPAQLPLQHPSPMASPFLRSTPPTADGAGSGASAAATIPQSPSEVPRPWSVLSGGFVDLLFSPPAAEPPPGVPNPVGLYGRGTSPGAAHSGANGGGAGGSRRHASFTGDAGGIISGTSNAAVGGLETVRSGDLTEDTQQDLHRAAGRARASTGTLGVGVGMEAVGSGVANGGVLVATVAGTMSASAASPSPLRPAVANAATVSRPTHKSGVVPHGGPVTAFVSTVPSVASASVAAVADGAATTTTTSRKGH
ncbi:hypothetical protein Vretifemale_13131 [Volvox reticuliferus]|nr:hypothetical protein Vretifemale_13131 [Volvox reticuliferus]